MKQHDARFERLRRAELQLEPRVRAVQHHAAFPQQQGHDDEHVVIDQAVLRQLSDYRSASNTMMSPPDSFFSAWIARGSKLRSNFEFFHVTF